ncbi:MAG: hypothetical protein ACO1N9_06095 [Flavobacterium sp.]
MEPNRFDNIVKEKLEQRTIQPREMAWDRLDAMLSVAEEKAAKPKKNRTWMYIAASFLGFLLVGTIFLKQGSDNDTNGKGTETQVAVTPEPAVNQGDASTSGVQAPAVNETIQVDEAVAVEMSPYKPERKVVVQKMYQNKPGANTPAPIVVDEAVAQNNKNEIAANPSNNEAEVLLADANTGQAKKPAIKVNANSLLSSVEGELDNSFRSKAMQTLVKNYNTVKTSVANRNHK